MAVTAYYKVIAIIWQSTKLYDSLVMMDPGSNHRSVTLQFIFCIYCEFWYQPNEDLLQIIKISIIKYHPVITRFGLFFLS